MEQIDIKLNNVERFKEVIENSLPDGGGLEIITNDSAMKSGRAGVMLTFTVQLPDGSIARAQAVTTMRMFRAIANAIVASYDDEGFRINMADPLDDGIIDSN